MTVYAFRKRLLLSVSVFILVTGHVSAQDPALNAAAAALAEDFGQALAEHDIGPFIDRYIITDDGLMRFADSENRSLGLAPDDPGRMTAETARDRTGRMISRLTRSFSAGLDALEVLGRVDAASLQIDEYSAERSYWNPELADISFKAVSRRASGEEVVVKLYGLSAAGGRLSLGPMSRLEFQGYKTEDVVAFLILEALRRRDPEYYADKVFTDPAGLAELMEAASEKGGYSLDDSLDDLYARTRRRIIADFEKLLERGDSEGIDWTGIYDIWSGYSASCDGQICDSSIPIEFSFSGRRYRIVLEFCSQLADDPSVFLPGEFVW